MLECQVLKIRDSFPACTSEGCKGPDSPADARQSSHADTSLLIFQSHLFNARPEFRASGAFKEISRMGGRGKLSGLDSAACLPQIQKGDDR